MEHVDEYFQRTLVRDGSWEAYKWRPREGGGGGVIDRARAEEIVSYERPRE